MQDPTFNLVSLIKQPAVVVARLKVTVNALLAIMQLLCGKVSWLAHAANSYLDLKIILLFSLLTHAEVLLIQSEGGTPTAVSALPPACLTSHSGLPHMQASLTHRVRQSPGGE